MDKKKTRIYCGFPSTGTSETVHMYLLRDLQERYGHSIELVLPDICVHRLFHDHARNAIVEDFLQSDCDILWMLDSDVVPPTHILDLVAHHQDKWQIAGAPYPIYSTVPGNSNMSILYTVYKGIDDKSTQRGIYMAEAPQSGTEFVDGLATGCLFIKREVFAKLEQPYFEFKFNPKTRVITEGEDLGFALKCHDLGIKFFVDYGMTCKHYKRVCLLEMTNYAVSMANAKTLDYDKSIRSQVAEAINAAYAQGYEKGLSSTPKKTNTTKAGLILPNSFQTQQSGSSPIQLTSHS